MKKKLNIPKDFWKDFKDRKDFDEFFQVGVNQMLKGEMAGHRGYEKNYKDRDNSGNFRNGDYPKTLKTNLSEIPRDRNGDLDPKAVPKHETPDLYILITCFTLIISIGVPGIFSLF